MTALRRNKRRTSRRRRSSVRRNPLTKKKKILLGVGGLVVAGGIAALLVSKASAQAPPGPDAPPDLAALKAAKAAECAALQSRLTALRAQSTPDRGVMTQLEADIATCIAEAAAMGVNLDLATVNLSAGDALFALIEAWFTEYRATDAGDVLRRNNIRKEMLEKGAMMAVAYTDAVTQTSDNQAIKVVAQSILWALQSAITRRVCYLYDQRGCGRFGENEPHGNDRAAAVQTRVVAPLLAAYDLAVTKVGGPTRALVAAKGEDFLRVLLAPCSTAKDFIDAQFIEYRATDGSDVIKRNNLRISMLATGRELVACLRGVATLATSFRSAISANAVYRLTIAALGNAMSRRACYLYDYPGCGRFGENEPHGNDKAAEERTVFVGPLTVLATELVTTLKGMGGWNASDQLVETKLHGCSLTKNFLDKQFADYKRTPGEDPLRRGNLRGSMLEAGGALASCLQDAFDLAKSSTGPTRAVSGLGALGFELVQIGDRLRSAMQTSPAEIASPVAMPGTASGGGAQQTAIQTTGSVDYSARFVPVVGEATLAALNAAMDRRKCFLYDPPGANCGHFPEHERTVAPLLAVYEQIAAFLRAKGNMSATTALIELKVRQRAAAKDFLDKQFADYKRTPGGDFARRNNLRGSMLPVGALLATELRADLDLAIAANVQANVRSVDAVTRAALDAAMTRRVCYLLDFPGCGRTGGGDYEPHGNDKAAEEQTRMIAPFTEVSRRAAAYLVANGDAQAEVPLVNVLVRSVVAQKDFIDNQFADYKRTPGDDYVRRNNLRGSMLAIGRMMVAEFRAIRPTTPPGRAVVRAAAEAALVKARERETCYLRSHPGCGRFADFEPHENDRAAEERTVFIGPLTALLADRTPTGLGSSFVVDGFAGLSMYTWLGIGAVGLFAISAYRAAPKKNPRRRKRRSSRRRSSRCTSHRRPDHRRTSRMESR